MKKAAEGVHDPQDRIFIPAFINIQFTKCDIKNKMIFQEYFAAYLENLHIEKLNDLMYNKMRNNFRSAE